MSYSAYDPNTLWRFFVRSDSGKPVRATDRLKFRQHDWGGDASAPLGYQTADCVLSADGLAAYQYESFPPWRGPYTDNPGNGGDIGVLTADGHLTLVATMDGSDPGVLYYFVGPGIGMPADGRVGGWLIAGPDVAVDSWHSTICYLIQSYNDPHHPIGTLNPSYTRYAISHLDVPFQINGVIQPPRLIEVLVAEHYNGTDPTTSDSMERFHFGAGWGKLRWEAWSSVPPGNELIQRAPAVALGFPNPSLNPAHHLVDVRVWTNIVPEPKSLITANMYIPVRPGARVADFGWPPNFVLP